MQCETTAQPLRIAIVYSRLPFPMMRGDQITVAHLISFLATRGHIVDLYTIAADGQLSPEQEAWLRRSCRRTHFYSQSRWAKMVGLLVGIAQRMPLQASIFRNAKLQSELFDAIEACDYDIVYCYYLRTAYAVPTSVLERPDTASFLALQLSQTLNTTRMASNERRPLRRIVYRVESKMLGRFESRIWRSFDKVVLIGPADVAAIESQCRKHGGPLIDNWVFGAHGTDTDKYVAARSDEIVPGRVIFSGSMLYSPNIQAALWFAENVWPHVRGAVPNATFVIQGRDPAPEIRKLDGDDGIWVTGTVPDVGVLIRSAQVCVNPMLAAGGMQNKLIEYMASSKAVVASSVANEGIRAPAGTLMIADTAAEFSDAVVRLLTDPDLAGQLGEAARKYVLAEWTWEKHFLDLERAFYTALDEKDSASNTH